MASGAEAGPVLGIDTGGPRADLALVAGGRVLAEGSHTYLENIRSECSQIHAAIHQIYFDYSIESEVAS